MKYPFTLLILVLVFVSFQRKAIAQPTREDYEKMMVVPKVHLDWLKENTKELTTQKFNTNNSLWENQLKDIYVKDAEGGFTKTALFSWQANNWDTVSATNYYYQKDASNNVTGLTILTYPYYATMKGSRVNYFYKQGLIDSAYVEDIKSFGSSTDGYVLYRYNSNSQRVLDSLVFQNGLIQSRHYWYDANGRCIGQAYTKINSMNTLDTLLKEVVEYSISGLLLKWTRFSSNGTALYKSDENVYTYTPSGKIKSMEYFSINGVKRYSYFNYYNTSDKLVAMVKKADYIAAGANEDSIVLTYNQAGQLDTAYSYWHLDTFKWKAQPPFRYIYEKLTVGTELFNSALAPINIYPNPVTHSNSLVNISVPTLQTETSCSITITDLTGRRVMTKHFPENQSLFSIEVGQLERGTYLLNVVTDERNIAGTCRVVVQ
jgi:hypothetical protein